MTALSLRRIIDVREESCIFGNLQRCLKKDCRYYSFNAPHCEWKMLQQAKRRKRKKPAEKEKVKNHVT